MISVCSVISVFSVLSLFDFFSLKRQDAGFESEQEFLALDPTAISRQLSVRSHHAMTGNDNRDWIAAVGRAHGARGAWVAKQFRDRAVGRG